MQAETRQKILVVDDDDSIRAMVTRVLAREAFQVDCARDGFEAIEKLSGADYGAVLLDLMMPRIDGHGVLEYLDVERNATPSVIVMTADLHGAAQVTRSRPVWRILPKPFDIRQLVSHVRELAGVDPTA